MSVVGIVAYRGPYFGIFDTLKEKNPFKKEKGIVGLASKFCIAQFTAIVAGFISYPFDTVRRRLQMQAEKPPDQWLYNGTLDCAVKIVRDEGMGAMFKVRRRPVSIPSPPPPPPPSPRRRAPPLAARNRPSPLHHTVSSFLPSLGSFLSSRPPSSPPSSVPPLLAPPFSRLHACTVHPPPRHPLPASLPPTLPPSLLLHAHRTHPCARSTHDPPCTRPTINMPFRQGFAANVLRTLGGALVLVGYDEIKRIIG